MGVAGQAPTAATRGLVGELKADGQDNPTATLLEHTLLTQGFMGTSKAAFHCRLRP